MMTLTPYSRQLVTDNTTYNCSLRLNGDVGGIGVNPLQLDDNKWLRYGVSYATGGYAVYQDAIDYGVASDAISISSYDLMAFYDAQDGNGYQLQPMMSGIYDPPLTFSAGDQVVIPNPALEISW